MAGFGKTKTIPRIYRPPYSRDNVVTSIIIYEGAEHAFRKASGYAQVFTATLAAEMLDGQNYAVREIEISTTIAAEDTSGTTIGVKAVYDGVEQAAYENAGGYTGVRTVTWNVKVAPGTKSATVAIQAASDATHGIFVRTLTVRAVVVRLKE